MKPDGVPHVCWRAPVIEFGEMANDKKEGALKR